MSIKLLRRNGKDKGEESNFKNQIYIYVGLINN